MGTQEWLTLKRKIISIEQEMFCKPNSHLILDFNHNLATRLAELDQRLFAEVKMYS